MSKCIGDEDGVLCCVGGRQPDHQLKVWLAALWQSETTTFWRPRWSHSSPLSLFLCVGIALKVTVQWNLRQSLLILFLLFLTFTFTLALFSLTFVGRVSTSTLCVEVSSASSAATKAIYWRWRLSQFLSKIWAALSFFFAAAFMIAIKKSLTLPLLLFNVR